MHSRFGLSLVELLVVLAIIAVVLALLFPVVQMARERAREAVCRNNVYQINLAVVHYQEVHKKLPSAGRSGKIGGWVVDILPFIEQRNLLASISPGADVSSAPETIFSRQRSSNVLRVWLSTRGHPIKCIAVITRW